MDGSRRDHRAISCHLRWICAVRRFLAFAPNAGRQGIPCRTGARIGAAGAGLVRHACTARL